MAEAESVILGHKYRDTVSGWTGVATSRHEYMNGCIRITIEGADKDGKPEGYIFDVQQIELVDETPVNPTPHLPARTGGPRTNRPPER